MLPVTLICVDTLNHTLAAHALLTSMSRCEFAKAKWFTNELPEHLPDSVEIVKIAPIKKLADYSRIVMKDLCPHVNTSHALIIQWDGYVLDPKSWRQEFLEYDYIGAPWFWKEKNKVGNGGFSLRSRKLLYALSAKEFEMIPGLNEDELICDHYRKTLEKKYKIRFASESVAKEFSFESEIPEKMTFGFHGAFNFCWVMSEKKLCQLIPYINRKDSAAINALIQNCKTRGFDAAVQLLEK